MSGGAKFCSSCGSALGTKEAAPTRAADAGAPVDARPRAAGVVTASETSVAARHAYTPAHLVERILTRRSTLEGERKLVTVLFADIADSSALAQRVDPERLRQLIGEVLELVSEAVHRYEGTVNQYLGDGLMALFGAPLALEDHPLRAVQAALAIQETIRGYSTQFRGEHGVELRLRIGINTGPVVVGRIGDDLRMDYTAVSNTTYIAARMQTEAEPGAILMAEATHRHVEGYVLCESLGRVDVRGHREPVAVYRVTGRRRWRNRLEMSAARGLTRLVGRRRELALLHDCLLRVEAGHGQVVGVFGEPGVGKSRILYELHASLGDERVDWLEGHCVAYGRTVPYGPVLDILRAQFHIEEGDNPLQTQEKLRNGLQRLDAGLSPLLPFLEALFALPGADEALRYLDRQHRRQQTLEAIRAVIAAASRHRPQVLVCENLHWIDQSSEDLLNFLAGSLSGLPVLILTTHRTGYTVRWPDKPHYTQISLDGLARTEIEDMLAALLGGHEFPAGFLQFIRDKADGNPLFIEELTQTLLERSLLIRENGHVRLGSEAALEWPATIQDIIRARVDRLEDPVKDTLRMAAVIGREFEFRLLARVSSEPAEIAGHLEALKRLDVIHESRFFPQLEYRFKHAIIQDVIYKSLLVPRRQTLHGVVGQSIEELCADQLEEQSVVLAYHYSLSDHQDHAIKYALLAGDRAARVYASAEAARYYEQALELTRALTASPERQRAEIDACIKHAQVGTTRQDIERSRKNMVAARALAEQLADQPRLARVLYWMGRVEYVVGNTRTAIQYAEQSLKIAEDLADDALTAPPVNLLGRLYWQQGALRQAITLLERSTEHMLRLGNLTDAATTAGFAGMALGDAGELTRAVQRADQGVQLATEIQNPFAQAAVHYFRGHVRSNRGEWAAAIDDFREGRRIAEEAGDRFRIYTLKVYEGRAHTMAGDAPRGRQVLEECIAIAAQLGTTLFLSRPKAFLAECLLELGEIEAACRLAQEVVCLAEESGERHGNALARRAWAGTLFRQDPPDLSGAETRLLEAIKIQEENGEKPELARSLVVYVKLLMGMGKADRAHEMQARAVAMFREMGMVWDRERAEGIR